MFIDIVSYTKTTTKLDREEFNRLHDAFDQICLNSYKEHSGKVIKKIGDAFLVTFRSATEAVLCGVKLQENFGNYNHKNKNPIQIRVALHAGEILHRNGDIYGDTVNIAARVESIAEADQVVFSETVYSAMNKNEVKYLFLGERKLKGLRRPLKVFRVRTKRDEILKRRRKVRKFVQKLKSFILKLIVLVIIILGVWYLWRRWF